MFAWIVALAEPAGPPFRRDAQILYRQTVIIMRETSDFHDPRSQQTFRAF